MRRTYRPTIHTLPTSPSSKNSIASAKARLTLICLKHFHNRVWSYVERCQREACPILLPSFNLSISPFIRLKIRMDVHSTLSYRYLLLIKDRVGRVQRRTPHPLV